MRTEYIYEIEFETSATYSFKLEIVAKDFEDAYSKVNTLMQNNVNYQRLKSIVEIKDINIID